MNKEKSLRAQVSEFSRGDRVRTLENLPMDIPISHKSDSIIFDGRLRTRKRIVLLTSGCGIGTCTMCPFPNESLAGVSEQNIINQFDHSFIDTTISDHEVITIFNNGNFFRDSEITPKVRDYIYDKVRNSGSKYLSVESLPQFVTEQKILDAKEKLGDVRLSVFMGFQTSNDFIREVAINTTCTKKAFETAVSNLLANNFIPVAFLMIKPPFLTEVEAIEDTCTSIEYLADIGVSYATLCPTRVAPNTVLEKLHRASMYTPPWTWSVIEILKRNRDAGISLPMVNTSELKSDMNEDSLCAQGCPKCTDRNIKAIEQFLYTRDFSLIDSLDCDCQEDYEEFKREETATWSYLTIEDRIKMFLEMQKKMLR